MSAPASQTGLSSPTEPCSTVSALTGFDPSRKSDAFQIRMDASRRAGALEKAGEAANAIYWLRENGIRALTGSTYGDGWTGHEEAKPYLKAAQETFSHQIRDHAIDLALIDLEDGYASAIEARSDAAPQSDAAEGESAAPEGGDAR